MNQSDFNEIALKVGLQAFEEHPYDKGHVVSPSGYTWIDDKLIEFAEAIIESYKAELLKEAGEPVACVDKRDWDWHLVNSPETSLGIWPTSDWKRKLNLPYQVPMFLYTSDQLAAAIIATDKARAAIKESEGK